MRRVVNYKAYRSYGYDQRQELFSQVNIYTMSANVVDVNREIVDYYDRQHPADPIIATTGANQRIIVINRDQRLGSVGDDHIIVPISLTIKKYYNIPASEIEILEQEVRDSGDVWAGSINNSGVSFGGEIRAMLQNVGEEQLLHPVTEDTQRTYASAAKDEEENDDFSTYTEFYTFHEKNGGSCNYWNCPIHFGNFRKLPWERQWVLLGVPLSHPKVIKMSKLRRMKRLVDYNRLLLMSLEVTDSVDAVDKPDYYDKMQ